MSYSEALQWMAYRTKHGPLDPGGRLELHLANIQAMIANALGNDKVKPQDFVMSERYKPQAGVSMNQIMAAFKSAGAQ